MLIGHKDKTAPDSTLVRCQILCSGLSFGIVIFQTEKTFSVIKSLEFISRTYVNTGVISGGRVESGDR